LTGRTFQEGLNRQRPEDARHGIDGDTNLLHRSCITLHLGLWISSYSVQENENHAGSFINSYQYQFTSEEQPSQSAASPTSPSSSATSSSTSAPIPSSRVPTVRWSATTPIRGLILLLILGQFDYLLRNSQIFNIISSYVNFWKSKETVTFRAGLDNFFQSQVHPVIAIDEVAVESLSVLQLDEHRVALGRGKQTKREHVEG